MPGVLARLQELLNVQPERRGDNLRCFFDTFNQQDPPTPVSARNYDHAADEFTGLGRNSRPRPVTDISGVVRKLHDRNGQLFNVAPNSDARHSPKWFSARSISSAARSLISWGFPWVRNEVLRESWGTTFIWDDASVELFSVSAFNKKIISVPLAANNHSPERRDLAILAYCCGLFLTRDLVYYCDVCSSCVKLRGLHVDQQLQCLARHFNSSGHTDNQGSLPGRANRGRLSVFPYFFIDHPCFKELSALDFMDNLKSDVLNPSLKRFAATLREKLRPDVHFVYIHKGMGRFFCLAHRHEFEVQSASRRNNVPFILNEGTCPYNDVIEASLQRLKQENFGLPTEQSTLASDGEGELRLSETYVPLPIDILMNLNPFLYRGGGNRSLLDPHYMAIGVTLLILHLLRPEFVRSTMNHKDPEESNVMKNIGTS
ncbi:hypothetical protein Pmar_PMAR015181 [Perkinsus marinus ATCC 50983]|uniref:Uncharacterized protein n=1 Tax=Perkinsus marinus (strain ATCC 50983 / TXsc) TaxID=423536 RepID=C5K5N4_PERM5|nr:hypothetical protein Pmar_PMAR015181 [Perkinsus marinus ATCC 50983]EER20191.1 hypothetical protein Pmar_PMAR015181 [Perkinsus marinus ATCC 50983]|eukprot:XP_002788395.1 hypothetical protein Pmar_PMAR015181 [Perkinsus marinus ATCC 50983]